MSPVLFLALFSELRLLDLSSVTISGFLCFITLEALFRKPLLISNFSISVLKFNFKHMLCSFLYIQLWPEEANWKVHSIISDKERCAKVVILHSSTSCLITVFIKLNEEPSFQTIFLSSRSSVCTGGLSCLAKHPRAPWLQDFSPCSLSESMFFYICSACTV